MLLAGTGSAGAGVRYLSMDSFEDTFRGLPSGGFRYSRPWETGSVGQANGPFASYGGCAKLRFPAGTRISEIAYRASGNSGWTYAALREYRCGESNLVDFDIVNHPAAGEHTLHAATDPPVVVRRGYSYAICFEGQPGSGTTDDNSVEGFKVTFRRR